MDITNPPPIKEKKRIGRTPRYTEEYYMAMAKEVVEDGLSFRAAGTKYNCSHGTVSHWSKMYRTGKLKDRIKRKKAVTFSVATQLQKQEHYIRQLKAEIGELYLENQLLKKLQGCFQQRKNEPTSVITSENLDQFREGAE